MTNQQRMRVGQHKQGHAKARRSPSVKGQEVVRQIQLGRTTQRQEWICNDKVQRQQRQVQPTTPTNGMTAPVKRSCAMKAVNPSAKSLALIQKDSSLARLLANAELPRIVMSVTDSEKTKPMRARPSKGIKLPKQLRLCRNESEPRC